MKLIKNTIRTEVIYDDGLNNKFLIKKECNQQEKKAFFIMKKAGKANEIFESKDAVIYRFDPNENSMGKIELNKLTRKVQK